MDDGRRREIDQKMKSKIRTVRDLKVYRKAFDSAMEIFEITKKFPKEELFGLTSQFKRAAVSIPANIAEGFRKRGKKDKARFFNIAQGSLEECKYYLILTEDLGYAPVKDEFNLAEEISKLLTAYSKKILTSIS